MNLIKVSEIRIIKYLLYFLLLTEEFCSDSVCHFNHVGISELIKFSALKGNKFFLLIGNSQNYIYTSFFGKTFCFLNIGLDLSFQLII